MDGARPSADEIVNALVDNARRANQDATDCEEHARIHRARRDVFVRRLYATELFSYPRLSQLVGGVSPELIAKIVRAGAGKRSNKSERK